MIAEVFGSIIKAAPDMKLHALKQLVRKEMGIAVTTSQCRRAKLRVIQALMGSEVKEYALLWDYAEELRRKNSGSTIILNVRRDFDANRVIFDKFYVCFFACKRGYLDGCRRVFGLDGCFLKGVCKGEVLSAIGRDANNQMYPIAWAVVRIENKETWNWFLNRLMDDLEIDRDDGGEGWTIISDKQKGLVDAISTLMPEAEHRMCARHIYANWGSKYKGTLFRKMFWVIAKSTNNSDYEAASRRLYNANKDGWTDLMKTDPKHWCKSFFNTDVKCDIVDNNLCESFNGRLVDERSKSIISMLEDIRLMVMERIYKQREQVRKWKSEYGPRIINKVEENKREARWCMARWNGGDEFEVQHNSDIYDVNISKRICARRAWDLCGIPCCHAVSAIILTGGLLKDLIDEHYSKSMFLNLYANLMNAIRGEKFWKKTGLQGPEPLPPRKKLGRLPKARRKNPIEGVSGDKMTRHGRKMTCSNCKQEGHNRATCKQPTGVLGQPSTHEQQSRRVKLNPRRAHDALPQSDAHPPQADWNIHQWNDAQPFVHTDYTEEEVLTSPMTTPFVPTDQTEQQEKCHLGGDAPAATQDTDSMEIHSTINKKKNTLTETVVSFMKRRSMRLMSSPRKNYSEKYKGKSNQADRNEVIELE